MATSKSKGVINIEKQGLLGSQMTPNPKFLTRDKSIPKRLTMGIKRMLEWQKSRSVLSRYSITIKEPILQTEHSHFYSKASQNTKFQNANIPNFSKVDIQLRWVQIKVTWTVSPLQVTSIFRYQRGSQFSTSNLRVITGKLNKVTNFRASRVRESRVRSTFEMLALLQTSIPLKLFTRRRGSSEESTQQWWLNRVRRAQKLQACLIALTSHQGSLQTIQASPNRIWESTIRWLNRSCSWTSTTVPPNPTSALLRQT